MRQRNTSLKTDALVANSNVDPWPWKVKKDLLSVLGSLSDACLFSL